MKKKQLKARTTEILLQIHRGFLPDEAEISDEDLLATIPTGLTSRGPSLVAKPFTYKWVANHIKKQPTITAFDLLVEAGFKEADDKEILS